MASIVLARGVAKDLFAIGFPPHSADEGAVKGLVFLDPHTQSRDVSVFDRAVLRGDGFFEAISVIDGKIPVSLDLHMQRLATSAAMLDMPHPDVEAFREACLEMIAHYSGGHDDPMLRILVSRGLDFGTGIGRELGAGIPSVWMYMDGQGARHSTEPLTVVSLTAGFDSQTAAGAPWLLLGAKTLSYASNMAAEREARRRGVDDALYVTSDGLVLESPHASVVARFGDNFVTPDPAIGVLHGTTQQELFAYARRRGFSTEYRDVTLTELKSADAIYQTRGGWVVPVAKVDGTQIGDGGGAGAAGNDGADGGNAGFVAAANTAIHYERAKQEEELDNDDYGL
jgi:4-amino-4-deoxychorismate lyase